MGMRMKVTWLVSVFLVIVFTAPFAVNADSGKPIPLFPDMQVNGATVSPDGRHIAFTSPVEGAENLWVGTLNPDEKPRLLTASERSIRGFSWAWNSKQVVYRVDPAGDERYQYLAVDVETGDQIELSPEFAEDGHRVSSWGEGFYMNNNTDPAYPDAILVLTNELDADRNDIWRVDLTTGDRELVMTGRTDVQRWLVDNNLDVRGFIRGEENGGNSLWLSDANGMFAEALSFEAGDVAHLDQFDFSDDNSAMYFLNSSGRDTKALVELNLSSLELRVISTSDEVDASFFTFDPWRHIPLAVGYFTARMDLDILDDAFSGLFQIASSLGDGEDVYITPVTDTGLIKALYSSSTSPMTALLIDTASGRTYTYGIQPEPDQDHQYCEMQPVRFTARDGLTLHGYLTVPHSFDQPGPMVLLVHGGPNTRDRWFFNQEVQDIVSWGYACLQVNFRGSRGYGKRFFDAGNCEWGAAMQDDLSDGVAWAVDQGIADPARVAIMGESYGGYAVLAGMTFTPEQYAAGIALNPISDLETHLTHWSEFRPAWRAETDLRWGRLPRYADGPRAGEVKVEVDWDAEDRAMIELLNERSPIYSVDRIQAPLLVAHGEADSRVLEKDSARFVEACRALGLDIDYITFKGEGHWLARPESYEEYNSRAKQLLNRTIGVDQ